MGRRKREEPVVNDHYVDAYKEDFDEREERRERRRAHKAELLEGIRKITDFIKELREKHK